MTVISLLTTKYSISCNNKFNNPVLRMLPYKQVRVFSELYMRVSLSLFLVYFLVCSVQAERKLEFNRDIRPILSDGCFHCHGPDEKERKGGLRLDLESDAFKNAKSGFPAIVKGDPDESEIIARIFLSDDDEEHMPPLDSGKSITLEQKEILKKWIEQGAEYQGHWAFINPQRSPVPKVIGAKHPIDGFIQKRLSEEGMQMQALADKETLLRRVSLDLTGLPPTLSEVDDFLADTSENAYEKVLDRLLGSPHYGERMALEWLDLARYADSNGFQSDGSRDMWLWRDWLINAFNRNIPFDQFTIEQLAGDMLPNPSQDQVVATGFNRNHRLNGEGGRIVDEWFVETVIDRVETTGTTWLALTMSCARCHDHKYDPISQKEFFEFFAYFNSNDESGVLAANGKNGFNTAPFLKVPNSEQKRKISHLEDSLQKSQDERKSAESKMEDALTKWLKQTREELVKNKAQPSPWKKLTNEKVLSKGGAQFKKQKDGSWLGTGKNPSNDTYEIRSPFNSKELSGVLLESFSDPSFKGIKFGRSGNGNFVMTGLEVRLEHKDKNKKPIVLKLDKAEASYEQEGYPAIQVVKNAANLKKKGSKGWAVHGSNPPKQRSLMAMFMAKSPISVPEGAELVITIYHQSGFADHNLGRFRIQYAEKKVSSLDGVSGIPENLVPLVRKNVEGLAPQELNQLKKYFRTEVENPVSVAKVKADQSKKALDDFMSKVPSTMIMKEKSAPRDAFILNRGEYDQPTEKVGRALPAVLPPLPEGQPNDRLGLARWLVSGDHPLTARVWVNRIWERLFGVGIVKTSENFGSQAEWPVHPELLDWLAVEFAKPTALPKINGKPAQAWDMKGMIKFIMLSKTYRQNSSAPDGYFRKDPENRLLARGPRFRLHGELVRDQALASSGLLIKKVGGPSTRPYMPKGVWSETNRYGNLTNYKADEGEGLYRRSMYTFWKRTAAPPSMLLFDAPNREICYPKRSRTNTPLQALALLNEVTYVEAARSLAERMMKEGGAGIRDRLTTGYRLATSRSPDKQTLSVLQKGFEERKIHFQENQEAAKQMISHGKKKPDENLEPVELAAYTVTANVLLNLDRVITKD